MRVYYNLRERKTKQSRTVECIRDPYGDISEAARALEAYPRRMGTLGICAICGRPHVRGMVLAEGDTAWILCLRASCLRRLSLLWRPNAEAPTLREQYGLTFVQVARAYGCSAKRLAEIEQGQRSTIEVLGRYREACEAARALALGCPDPRPPQPSRAYQAPPAGSLKALRKSAGLSLADLGSRIGVSSVRAWQIEHAQRITRATHDRWVEACESALDINGKVKLTNDSANHV